MQEKIPDKEILLECLKKIEELTNSLFLATSKKKNDYPYFAAHLQLGIKDVKNKAFAISHLSGYYLNEIYVLTRNAIEIVIDMFWVLSHGKIKDEYVETLSKRFFMQSANDFLKFSESTEWNIENSKFIGENNNKINLSDQIESAKCYQNITELYDVNACKELKNKQERDWRLLPYYYSSSKDVVFSKRAENAKDLFQKICKIQRYTFASDYRLLSKFVHPGSVRFDVANDHTLTYAMYLRMLNYALCNCMYLINLFLYIHQIDKSSKYREVECVLLWP